MGFRGKEAAFAMVEQRREEQATVEQRHGTEIADAIDHYRKANVEYIQADRDERQVREDFERAMKHAVEARQKVFDARSALLAAIEGH